MSTCQNAKAKINKFAEAELSEIIQMALSDETTFADIRSQYNISEQDVKALMRRNLKTGSYKAWRKRVSKLSSRREFYK